MLERLIAFLVVLGLLLAWASHGHAGFSPPLTPGDPPARAQEVAGAVEPPREKGERSRLLPFET